MPSKTSSLNNFFGELMRAADKHHSLFMGHDSHVISAAKGKLREWKNKNIGSLPMVSNKRWLEYQGKLEELNRLLKPALGRATGSVAERLMGEMLESIQRLDPDDPRG